MGKEGTTLLSWELHLESREGALLFLPREQKPTSVHPDPAVLREQSFLSRLWLLAGRAQE